MGSDIRGRIRHCLQDFVLKSKFIFILSLYVDHFPIGAQGTDFRETGLTRIVVNMGEHTVVGVIGHSYVKRLERFSLQHPVYKNLCLNKDVYKVCFRSQGGLTIRGLTNSPKLCTFTSVPILGFLDIGGNDATTRAALDIAQDIVAYANYLVHGLGVVNVVIGQLLRCDPRKSPAGYNDEVLKINTHLQQLTLGIHHIHFWRHRVFWADLSYLGRDGVHLWVESYANSPAPMVKYIRSIKYAMHNRMQKIKASSHCILYKFHVK